MFVLNHRSNIFFVIGRENQNLFLSLTFPETHYLCSGILQQNIYHFIHLDREEK